MKRFKDGIFLFDYDEALEEQAKYEEKKTSETKMISLITEGLID